VRIAATQTTATAATASASIPLDDFMQVSPDSHALSPACTSKAREQRRRGIQISQRSPSISPRPAAVKRKKEPGNGVERMSRWK
jgi:hypothetical protein